MRKIIAILLAVSLVCGFTVSTFASDWDVAGKVLTGIEGVRILTGGKVDIIGNIVGLDKDKREDHHVYVHKEKCRRVWNPHYIWERKWVPEHKEYDARLGEIIVEGHYIKYRVERGGSWNYDCSSCKLDH